MAASDEDALLTPEQHRDLSAVLDEIVPPSADGRLPGAGAVGVSHAIEAKMRESDALQPAVLDGLRVLAGLAREAGAAAFADVPPGERRALLERAAEDAPAFLPGLVFQTYVHYYHEPSVLEGLGIPARPPHPEGYALAPLDERLLEPVRGRPPLYRRP